MTGFKRLAVSCLALVAGALFAGAAYAGPVQLPVTVCSQPTAQNCPIDAICVPLVAPSCWVELRWVGCRDERACERLNGESRWQHVIQAVAQLCAAGYCGNDPESPPPDIATVKAMMAGKVAVYGPHVPDPYEPTVAQLCAAGYCGNDPESPPPDIATVKAMMAILAGH